MAEFLIKFENRGIKIARVNSIFITKSINLKLFTLILYGVGVPWDRRLFSLHREVYGAATLNYHKLLHSIWSGAYLYIRELEVSIFMATV